jgi:glycosyltransferase involved in cell wall biosynthesis
MTASSSNQRPTVIFASNLLGLGGTEKGLVAHALALDRERFDVRALAIHASGPRQAQLEEAGIPVDCAHGDRKRLADLLGGADIVQVFRQGNTEPLLPNAARDAGVRFLVEWSMFGQADRSPQERQFSCHLFNSKFCLMRYRERVGDRSPEFHRRHRVLYLGLDLDRLRQCAPEKHAAREELGLDPNRPVIGRIGRDADLKWRNLLVDMVPTLVSIAPETQILFVGATPAKRDRLARRGMLDRCTLAPPVLDDRRLATYYAACDLTVNAAEIGESQGLAIAESMSLGRPVVTCSTPWADNAQVEFVEHRRTGLVANHPRAFGEAVAELVGDHDQRAALGAAAREQADALLDVNVLTRRLESLYDGLLTGRGVPAEWDPSPAEVEDFAQEYERRLSSSYRPLRIRERAEADWARRRERAGQIALHLNPRAWKAIAVRARARLRRVVP